MSGSVISWAICKSAPRSRQITTPVPHHSVFYRPDALPACKKNRVVGYEQRKKIIQSTYKQSLCYVITACHADRLILLMKFRTENVSAAGMFESAVDQPTCWSSAQRAERFQSVPQALETTVRLGEVS